MYTILGHIETRLIEFHIRVPTIYLQRNSEGMRQTQSSEHIFASNVCQHGCNQTQMNLLQDDFHVLKHYAHFRNKCTNKHSRTHVQSFQYFWTSNTLAHPYSFGHFDLTLRTMFILDLLAIYLKGIYFRDVIRRDLRHFDVKFTTERTFQEISDKISNQ